MIIVVMMLMMMMTMMTIMMAVDVNNTDMEVNNAIDSDKFCNFTAARMMIMRM